MDITLINVDNLPNYYNHNKNCDKICVFVGDIEQFEEVKKYDVTSIMLGNYIKSGLKPGMIPQTVKYLHFNNYEVMIEPGVIPNSVTIVNLGNYDNNINASTFPDSVKVLITGDNFNKPLPPKCLKSVEYVTFGSKFNSHIARNAFSSELIEITLGDSFNYPIGVGTLYNVKNLIIGDNFTQCIFEREIPDTVTHLEIGKKFSNLLSIKTLPIRLETLILNGYTHEINDNTFPQTLNTLDIGTDIKCGNVKSLPQSLEKLTICMSPDDLRSGLFSESLKILTINCDNMCITKNLLPPGLNELHLVNCNVYKIERDAIPQELKLLSFDIIPSELNSLLNDDDSTMSEIYKRIFPSSMKIRYKNIDYDNIEHFIESVLFNKTTNDYSNLTSLVDVINSDCSKLPIADVEEKCEIVTTNTDDLLSKIINLYHTACVEMATPGNKISSLHDIKKIVVDRLKSVAISHANNNENIMKIIRVLIQLKVPVSDEMVTQAEKNKKLYILLADVYIPQVEQILDFIFTHYTNSPRLLDNFYMQIRALIVMLNSI